MGSRKEKEPAWGGGWRQEGRGVVPNYLLQSIGEAKVPKILMPGPNLGGGEVRMGAHSQTGLVSLQKRPRGGRVPGVGGK